MTDRPDPADWIAAARSLTQAATPGPWSYGTPGAGLDVTARRFAEEFLRDPDAPADGVWCVLSDGWLDSDHRLCPAMTGDGPTSEANALFIAAARNALPKALDALEAVLELTKGHRAFATKRGRDDCICTICDICRAIESALRAES